MADRILVVGLGRFGAALVGGLTQRGRDVIVVDEDMARVDAFKDQAGYALQLDSTDVAALQAIDAHTCAVAVVAIGEDFEAAVLTVAALKECGVPRVIARARNARQARILRAVGADETIEVESEVGQRLAAALGAGRS
ncbi:MAG: potassium channel family protein [Planctomycetota bacterium]